VAHVVRAARAVPCRRVVAVLGVQRDEVRAAIEAASPEERVSFCVQAEQRGTAHAVLAAEKSLRRETGTLLILNGDVPLARPGTLRALLAHHARTGAAFTS